MVVLSPNVMWPSTLWAWVRRRYVDGPPCMNFIVDLERYRLLPETLLRFK